LPKPLPVDAQGIVRKLSGRLRFVERAVDGRTLRILQQEWAVSFRRAGANQYTVMEWRDVPVEAEQ
jgi:hypothetical protein